MSVTSHTPDPGSTQHTEKVHNAVAGMDEFEKVAAEMMQHLTGSDKEQEDSKAKAKEGSQTDHIAKANAFMLLNSQQAQVVETVVTYLKNIAGPSQPQLLPPAQGAKQLKSIPSDHTGTGNPWLVGSLTAKLFEIWLTMLPLLMKIKIKEAAFSAMQTTAMQDLAVAGAEAAKKATEKEADNLRLEAQQEFIKAGIAFGTMVMTVADKVASQVKSVADSAGSAVKEGMGKVGSAATTVAAGAASMAGGAIGGGDSGGDSNTANTDTKTDTQESGNNIETQENDALDSDAKTSTSNTPPPTSSASATNLDNSSKSGVLEGQNPDPAGGIGGAGSQNINSTTDTSSSSPAGKEENTTGGDAPPGETSSKTNEDPNKTNTESSASKSSTLENAKQFLHGAGQGAHMMGMQQHGNTKATGGAPPGVDAKTATALLNIAGDIANGVIKMRMADNKMAKAQLDFLAQTFKTMYESAEKGLNASQKAQQGASDQIAALFQAMQQFMEKVTAAFTFNR